MTLKRYCELVFDRRESARVGAKSNYFLVSDLGDLISLVDDFKKPT